MKGKALRMALISSDVLFCPTNSPKAKETQFIMLQNQEKQTILALVKLEPANVWPKKLLILLLHFQNCCQLIVLSID